MLPNFGPAYASDVPPTLVRTMSCQGFAPPSRMAYDFEWLEIYVGGQSARRGFEVSSCTEIAAMLRPPTGNYLI
jgi:hypothetical protein